MHIADCYRILKLPQDASLDDIKSAYRRLALQYHPDVRVVINHASSYGRLAAVITLVISLISPFILSFYTKVFPSFEVILLTFVIMCIPIAFIIGIIARIISRMNIAFAVVLKGSLTEKKRG
jgi:DnaJ-class molecular chaperone with C-terminal Zn finger domain